MIPVQLPLHLWLRDGATFSSYFPGPNQEPFAHLQQLTGGRWQPATYLWGGKGTGKTHLLQAACHAAGEHDLAAAYLPMAAADQFPCEVLEGLETVVIVCIDDVQSIAGNPEWETAIIHLFERIQESGTALVVAGHTMPAELGLQSPHLESRLAWGLQYQLLPLAEADKLSALQLRAHRRGIELPLESCRYLIRHYSLDMNLLFSSLDTLDQASLREKRRLTIPFIREVLKSTGQVKKS